MKRFVLPLLLSFAFSSAYGAKCIGHRGYFAHVSENSVASIEAALDIGGDGAEFDIRHTRDGIPIIMHDETLERVVDPADADCPSKQPIPAIPWAKIRDNCHLLDGQAVSTLKEALELFQGRDKLAFVELKDMPSSQFAQVLEQSRLNKDNIRFISFKTKFLRKAQRAVPGVKALRLSRYIPFFSFTRGMDVDRPLRFYTFVARIFGNETGVWTVDDDVELRKIHSKKIDYITTNRLDRCLETKP